MYTPKQFEFNDRQHIADFMKAHSFATIVTVKDNFPTATHLPFVIDEQDGDLLLTSHFARANAQWKEVLNNQVLVIFTGPHAYIDPKLYETELNVPTWNYVAIHAYGKGEVIDDINTVFEVLDRMINAFDAGYQKQWQKLPEEFKLRHVKGIVAFKIKVSNVQGKKKLSQNKSSEEKERIVDSVSKGIYSHEIELAEAMKGLLYSKKQ